MRVIFSIGAPIICGGILVPCYHVRELRKKGIDAYIVATGRNKELEAIAPFKDRGFLNELTDDDVLIAVRWEECDELEQYKGRKFQFVQGNDRFYYEMIKHTDLNRMLESRRRENWELIGVSKYCLRDFGRGEVVPNGVEERFFVKEERERDIDALIIGNNEPLKNIAYAIYMAQMSKHERIVWMGRETSEKYGVETITNPPQEEIPSIYQRAKHVYIYSRSEGFSLPLLEAMAAGCQVHTHDMGGNDFWHEGMTVEEGLEIAKKYSWENASNILCHTLKLQPQTK